MDVRRRCGEPGGRPEEAQRHEGRMRREVEGARASRVPFNGRRRVPEGQVVEGVKEPEGGGGDGSNDGASDTHTHTSQLADPRSAERTHTHTRARQLLFVFMQN